MSKHNGSGREAALRSTLAWVCWSSALWSLAQNNGIFVGGTGDGMARGAFIQSLNTVGIFTGGQGDGISRGTFAQPLNTTGIFKGGVGDGVVRGGFSQPINTTGIFTGGQGDGIVRGGFAQPLNSAGIFKGGAGDGMARGQGSNIKVALTCTALLEGPWNTSISLMSDALRSAGLVPLTEPYTVLGYAQAGDGGGESTNAVVLAATGNNAVVDWVRVELRDAAVPTTVVATRQALITRNGTVVNAATGTGPLEVKAAPGSYYVIVRHRNHLGVMTSAPLALSATATSLNFSSPSTPTFGTSGQKTIGAVNVLWAGDVNHDRSLKYTGANNDRDPVLVAVGSTTPNNVLADQYRAEDVNMDGSVKYTGASNDRDPILVNVGSTTPNNVRAEQVP